MIFECFSLLSEVLDTYTRAHQVNVALLWYLQHVGETVLELPCLYFPPVDEDVSLKRPSIPNPSCDGVQQCGLSRA